MQTKTALLEEIAMTLGGRAAEEIVFNEVTTGAANDLEKITHTAKQMVMRFGMSEKLGPRVLGRNRDMPFLGMEMGHEPDYSEEVAREIDDEVRRIIEDGHELASKILREHLDDLHRISQILIEHETIDKDQFERLVAGEAEDDRLPGAGARSSSARAEGRAAAPADHEAAAVPAARVGDAAARARRRTNLKPSLSGVRTPLEERFARPSVMGVINVTPDSFSDGGVHSGKRRRDHSGLRDARSSARRSSTSAASRRGLARRVSRWTRSCAVSCPCWKALPARRSRSTRRRRRSRGVRSSSAPSS